MTGFNLHIAGMTIRVTSSHSSLLNQLEMRCRGFLAPEASPSFEVRIHLDEGNPPHTYLTPAFTVKDGGISFNLPGFTGFVDPSRAAQLHLCSPIPAISAEYFLRVVVAALAYREGGLLVHAAGILREKKGYLFLGPSGAGKTTAASHPGGGTVVNDDLVVLMPAHQEWILYGTPFTNPTQQRPSATSGPAKALFFLVQSPRVFLEPVPNAQATASLLACTPVLNASDRPPIDRCQRIVHDLPAYFLHFLPDGSYWEEVDRILPPDRVERERPSFSSTDST